MKTGAPTSSQRRSEKQPTVRSVSHAVFAVFGLILSLATAGIAAAEPSTLLVQGNAKYEEGRFPEAAALYAQALEGGLDNAAVRYNLANALYRQGKIGEAIVQYRRGLQHDPSDADVRANLELARRKVGQRLDRDRDVIGLGSLFKLNDRFSRSRLLTAFLLSYCLFWALLPLGVFVRSPGFRASQAGLLLFTLYLGLSSFAVRPGADGSPELKLWGAGGRAAVITAQKAEVRSGNAENFHVIFALQEGMEVEVNDRRENWLQVVLPDGRKGWIKSDELEII